MDTPLSRMPNNSKFMMAHISCVNHIINKPPLIYIGTLPCLEISSFLRNHLPFGQQVPIHFHGFRVIATSGRDVKLLTSRL